MYAWIFRGSQEQGYLSLNTLYTGVYLNICEFTDVGSGICEAKNGGWGRNRTGVNGVAVRCMTTLPPSQVTLKVTVLTKAASLLENELKFTAEYRRILKI